MGMKLNKVGVAILHSEKILGLEEKKEDIKEEQPIPTSPEIVEDVKEEPVVPNPQIAFANVLAYRKKLRTVIAKELLACDPRLADYRFLLSMFVDLLEFRFNQKKEKIGFLKATINQITVAINVTKEMLDAIRE